MQRRRTVRQTPRDIFETIATREDIDRLFLEESTIGSGQNNELWRRTIIGTVQDTIAETKPHRPHKILKTPISPPVKISLDKITSQRTKALLSELTSSFEQREIDNGINRVVCGIGDLAGALKELREEDEDSFKRWLLVEKIPKLKQVADNLSGDRGLSPFEMWTDYEVANLYRDLEVLEYVARKQENNGFLMAFDITSMNGPNLRALVHLNNSLSRNNNSTHIGHGKIITFKQGVRIVLDCRRTMRRAFEGKCSIEAFVGPYHSPICLQSRGNSPPADWINTMVTIANIGWPDTLIQNELRGDGKLDINYQLGLWKSEEYQSIEQVIRDYYSSQRLENMLHSIEVYSRWNKVIIGTLSKKNTSLLIGKMGRKVRPLRREIRLNFGKTWNISIQEIA